MATTTRIAIVEDNGDFRREMVEALNEHEGWEVVAACANASEALEALPRTRPRLILLDIRLPDASGVDLIPTLKESLPEAMIIMLTVVENTAEIVRSFEAGAEGYLLKRDRDRLLKGVEDALNDEAAMSPAVALKVRDWIKSRHQKAHETRSLLEPFENKIMDLIARGMTQLEVAHELEVELHDVKNACKRIYQKLRVKSAAQAIAKLRSNDQSDI